MENLMRNDTAKQIRNVRKLLKGNQAESLPDALEPHEESAWEGLKWCAIWAIAVFIICCFLAVKAHAARVTTYGHDTCDTSCTPTYGGGFNCSTTC
jgi:hypothetical protein